MRNWQRPLRYDPIPPLVSSTDKALEYFVKRDLLDENVGPIDQVWQLPEARRMVKKQQADGSWKYPGKKTAVYPEHHYSLVETWKQFRFLVEKHEFNKEHPATRKASEFLFSCQKESKRASCSQVRITSRRRGPTRLWGFAVLGITASCC